MRQTLTPSGGHKQSSQQQPQQPVRTQPLTAIEVVKLEVQKQMEQHQQEVISSAYHSNQTGQRQRYHNPREQAYHEQQQRAAQLHASQNVHQTTNHSHNHQISREQASYVSRTGVSVDHRMDLRVAVDPRHSGVTGVDPRISMRDRKITAEAHRQHVSVSYRYDSVSVMKMFILTLCNTM